MIPELGTREECKTAVLDHCTQLPCADEVYMIFTPFQLKRGLTPDHEWKVLRAEGQHVTICRHYDHGDYQVMRLVHHIRLDDWLKRLNIGEIRYLLYDP